MTIEQVLSFILGLVYAIGGTFLAFQGIYDQKNMFETVGLAFLGALTGIFLCVWSFTNGHAFDLY